MCNSTGISALRIASSRRTGRLSRLLWGQLHVSCPSAPAPREAGAPDVADF